MAKQTSLIKINGKADGQSFYTSKNGGALMRSINKGMSARVKDSKEYANTRLNNAEFGAAGATAGLMVKTISSRWRYILSAIATGIMVKAIKKCMVLDNTGEWGQRGVLTAQCKYLRDTYTALSKNQVNSQFLASLIASMSFAANTKSFAVQEVNNNEDQRAELIAIGADKMRVSLYAFSVNTPDFDSNAKAYSIPKANFELITSSTSPLQAEDTVVAETTKALKESVLDAAGLVGGAFVLIEPIKTIGGEEYVLQQHCQGAWVEVAPAV